MWPRMTNRPSFIRHHQSPFTRKTRFGHRGRWNFTKYFNIKFDTSECGPQLVPHWQTIQRKFPTSPWNLFTFHRRQTPNGRNNTHVSLSRGDSLSVKTGLSPFYPVTQFLSVPCPSLSSVSMGLPPVDVVLPPGFHNELKTNRPRTPRITFHLSSVPLYPGVNKKRKTRNFPLQSIFVF